MSRLEKQAAKRRHGPDNTPEGRENDRLMISQARDIIKHHPVYLCPHREQHLNHARRALKARESAQLTRRRIETRTKSLSRQLSSICEVLRELNYLDNQNQLTSKGQMLQRVYNERDLLVVESLSQGIFSPLETDELAGLLSVCVLENRSSGLSPLIPAAASATLAGAIEAMARMNFELSKLQESHYLDPYPPLETQLALPIAAWARGASLNECLESSHQSAGDFVRSVRQVIDLADQLRKVSSDSREAQRFHRVISLLKRGVVAWDF